MEINVARNDFMRMKLRELFEDFGVSKKHFAEIAGLDYGLFTKFVGKKKNYVEKNLDKIEKVLDEKYGMFNMAV